MHISQKLQVSKLNSERIIYCIDILTIGVRRSLPSFSKEYQIIQYNVYLSDIGNMSKRINVSFCYYTVLIAPSLSFGLLLKERSRYYIPSHCKGRRSTAEDRIRLCGRPSARDHQTWITGATGARLDRHKSNR